MSEITVRRPIKWRSAAETNVGKVREINEDSIMDKSEIGLWAVADGMGGYEAGNVASNMIVQSLEKVQSSKHLNDFVNSIEDCIIDVNHRILEYAEIMLDGRTLGSTLISLLVHGQVGVCFWVGDSRLYRFRNNELQQISRDHSQVQELLKNGAISLEEAENHPDSNVITRAVGAYEDLCVDIDLFNVQVGDTYLLCSDGLYNAVGQDTIIQYMQGDVQNSVNNLIQRSLENGAPDNVSVIIVKGTPGNDNGPL